MTTDSSWELDVQKRRSRRYWHYALIIVVATILNVARLMEAEPLRSANDRSRWTTVWSLVERGTYQIDEIRQRDGWDTIDLVRHEGHFYSSKPPLLSTIVAGLYWVVKHSIGWTLDNQLLATTRLLLVLINIIPMTVALVLLTKLIDRYGASDFTRYFLIIAASTATLLQPFVTVLNNHTPGAISCAIALYAAVLILVEQRQSGWLYAMAGFWAACTSCFELPAALFGLAMFFLTAHENWRKTLIWFVPAAIVPLAAFFITNYWATGGWKPFYMFYGTEKYVFFEDGVPSYWMFPRGIDQAKDDALAYLLHCTIGHHGILSLTPIYLLTLAGWCNLRTWTESPLRLIHGLGLLLTTVVFCFFLTRTENYNYGGVSVALRWMLWLSPFWLLAMIPALDTWHPEGRGRAACTVLLAMSVFSAWYPLTTPWQQPWLFKVMEMAGWIDYSDDPDFGPPFQTWIRTLPPTSGDEPSPCWIEFEGLTSVGEIERLRIEDATGADVDFPNADDPNIRLIRFTTTHIAASGAESVIANVLIALDAEAFQDGRPIDELIVWSQVTPEDAPVDALSVLRGLPMSRSSTAGDAADAQPRPPLYQPRVIRYVDRPLKGRTEKFQCVQATGAIRQERTETLPSTIHRRDIWMTDDVPFGVLAFETSIHSARSRISQRMVAVDASHVEPFNPDRLLQNR